MRKIITIFLTSILMCSQAQIQHGGSPISQNSQYLSLPVPVVSTPETNVNALRREDEVVDQIKDIPWRYGYIHYMDVSMEDGIFEYLPNGDRVWRVKIESPGAQTVNITFDTYKLARGAQVFIYSENYKQVLGALTHENNKDHGFLTTTLIESHEATIELIEPLEIIGESELHIQRVIHGYRALDYRKKDIGASGQCNIDVICPEGDNWRDQIRSVGIILSQNNLSAGFCSGALINNACSEEKAYFLTANHCGADDPTTVVGFNFESTSCGVDNGPYLNNTISGVTERASNSGSDFMLLELSSLPPANYNVFYSGWDHSGVTPNGQVGIHHPAGDLKKISFDLDAPTQSTYSGALCWYISEWENGTTEGGSSGSPLFDLNGNIVGQLYAGLASCDMPNEYDVYGRFDVSWDGGTGPSNELKTWLDACNTGVSSIPGYDPNAITLNEDAVLGFSGVPGGTICDQGIAQKLILRNRGIQDLLNVEIKYGLPGSLQTYNWNGLLTSNQSETISLDSLDLPTGSYDYIAYITLTNLTQDENLSNDTVEFPINIVDGIDVTINLTTNFEASQNSILIVDGNDNIIEFEDNFDNTESYSFNYCLPKGDYCISIDDSGENGLSPTFFFDRGNFQLIIDGEEIFNGDSIGSLYEYCIEENPNGIRGALSTIDFSLYPNPTSAGFTIETEETINKVQLFDLLGSKVYEGDRESKTIFVSTEELAKGIFIVKVFTTKGTGLARLVVK